MKRCLFLLSCASACVLFFPPAVRGVVASAFCLLLAALVSGGDFFAETPKNTRGIAIRLTAVTVFFGAEMFVTEWSSSQRVRSLAQTLRLPPKLFLSLAALAVALSSGYALFRLYTWLLRPRTGTRRSTAIAVLTIALLVSLPLFMPGIDEARRHDLAFHLMRIEGIAQELSAGSFPVRMQSAWIYGYGVPVSIYYGDILLYLPALLRMAGLSIVSSYKAYVILVNLLTAAIAYACARSAFGDRRIALTVCLAYVASAYRFTNVYVRAAVGEYSAMIFYPVVALAAWRMFAPRKRASVRHNALLLAAGMTGILESHILSTEMTVLTLAAVCLAMGRETFDRRTLKTIFLAIGIFVLLNLWFIVPFADYYLSMRVSINETVEAGRRIQSAGAPIAQYFAFFQNLFGRTYDNLESRFLLTPGALLMSALGFSLWRWLSGQLGKAGKGLAAASAALLVLASDMFPWDDISCGVFGSILSQVQFPWRFLGVACVFLCALLGVLLRDEERRRELMAASVAIALLGLSVYISDYCGHIVPFKEYMHDSNPIWTGEYLLSGTDIALCDGKLASEGMLDVEKLSDDGMLLRCRADEQGGWIELPRFCYKGYRATDETGRSLPISAGANQTIRLTLERGYTGVIRVEFVEPALWRVSEIVSLMTLLVLGYCCLYGRQKAKRRTEAR